MWNRSAVSQAGRQVAAQFIHFFGIIECSSQPLLLALFDTLYTNISAGSSQGPH